MARLRTDIGIYIIHFDKPLVGGFKQFGGATHYVGKSGNIQERLIQHLHGKGSRNTKLAIEQGIQMVVGFTVNCEDTIPLENYYTAHARRYCRVCVAEHRSHARIYLSEIANPFKVSW
jgi:hypothetical protein